MVEATYLITEISPVLYAARTPSHMTTNHLRLEMSLEVIKHVIITRLNEEELAKKRAENRQEREKLLGILAEKRDGKLSELSERELQRRINALE